MPAVATASGATVIMQPRSHEHGLTRERSVSVVICCYTEQRWDQIDAAIESIRQQSLPAAEIVLVVDYNDRLLERATAAFRDVTVTPNLDDKGLSGGKNTGLRVSRGDIVAFLESLTGQVPANFATAPVLPTAAVMTSK